MKGLRDIQPPLTPMSPFFVPLPILDLQCHRAILAILQRPCGRSLDMSPLRTKEVPI
jgi:hypothetical protein